MKKFNIFGFKFSYKMEKINKDDVEEYVEEYQTRDRIVNMLLIIVLILTVGRIVHIIKEKHYIEGNIATENVYSPRDMKYVDKYKRAQIIENIINSTEKEYLYIEEVESKNIRALDKFYNEVLRMKYGNVIEYDFDEIEQSIKKEIPVEIADKILEKPIATIEKEKENMKTKLEEVYQIGVKRRDIIKGEDNFIDKYMKVTEEENKVLSLFLENNYTYDEEGMKAKIDEKVSKIGDQIVEIKAGEVLVQKGEILTAQKMNLLQEVGIYSLADKLYGLFRNAIYVILVTIIAYKVMMEKYKKEINNKNIYKATFLILVVGLLVFRLVSLEYLYLIPFDMIFILLNILVGPSYAFLMSVMLQGFLLPVTEYNTVYFAVSIISLLLGLTYSNVSKTRTNVINQGLELATVKVILYIVTSYLIGGSLKELIFNSTGIVISGLISGVFVLAIVPYFERTFNILTPFRLMELGDLSHPLLRDLSVKTPGTFYHSMIVSTMSAAAAEAIGADAILAKVASFYHDIGKIKRGKFFVENLEGEENPHDKISPYLSSLIILAHPSDGAELAKEYQIPKEIRDIMIEHHGTTLLTYFYNKAKGLNPNIREDDFRYSGPKPRTKESALIMLADSIEAAVRSIENKTQVSVEEMIRKIVFSKLDDGQLTDTDLTFRELETIIKVFTKTMLGIHHVRIKYPDQIGRKG